jgi:hypothetical protein
MCEAFYYNALRAPVFAVRIDGHQYIFWMDASCMLVSRRIQVKATEQGLGYQDIYVYHEACDAVAQKKERK